MVKVFVGLRRKVWVRVQEVGHHPACAGYWDGGGIQGLRWQSVRQIWKESVKDEVVVWI